MSLIIHNLTAITSRIVEYYTNAKKYKYPNSYDWSEVFNDIHLAETDTNFVPCSKSKPEWEKAGYSVIRNSRDWAFACIQEGEDILILDTDNCKCLTIDNTHTYNFSFLAQLRSTTTNTCIMRKPIGYGWWAIRHDDGFIYIHNRNGDIMPHIRFNEIVRIFRKRKDDPNIYAIGQYGDKNFKFYLNGKHVMLERRLRFKHDSLARLKCVINETVREVLRKII